MLDPEHASCFGHNCQSNSALLFIDTQKLLGCLGLDGVTGQTGSVALFERGEHQVRLVRVKQEESRTRLAKAQLDPYQIEIRLTLCGLGWV